MAGPPHGGIQVDAGGALCCLALESVDIGHAPRRSGADAAKAEFSEQGPLVDFLEKSGAQGVGDLKDGTQHALGQRIQLIGVPRRSSAAKLKCRPNAKALENNSSAADKRRDQRRFWPEPRDSPCPVNSWTLHQYIEPIYIRLIRSV